MRNSVVCVVMASMGVGGVAAGQVVVSDSGFDSQPSWQIVLINTPAGQSLMPQTGGNPGGFADLRSVLNNDMVAGAGFTQVQPQFRLSTFNPPLTEIRMSFDYRWISGETVECFPYLQQGIRLYSPPVSQRFMLGTDATWTTVAERVFSLSDFINSSGEPLNPNAFTQLGFAMILRRDVPSVVQGRVGIDNLHLSVVPAPGVGGMLVMAGVVGVGRRRRQGAEASPRT